jgi:hypothetical protein
LGLWLILKNPNIDSTNCLAFKASMNYYGKLEWEEFTKRSTSIDLWIYTKKYLLMAS